MQPRYDRRGRTRTEKAGTRTHLAVECGHAVPAGSQVRRARHGCGLVGGRAVILLGVRVGLPCARAVIVGALHWVRIPVVISQHMPSSQHAARGRNAKREIDLRVGVPARTTLLLGLDTETLAP